MRGALADRGPLQINSVSTELATKDYDQMLMTANGMWWVNGNGYRFGQQLTSDVLFFVPHTAWHGRATDTGALIGAQLPNAAANVNVSSPLWIEFFIDFSWPGVIVGFITVGYYSRRLDELFARLRATVRTSPAVLDIGLPILVGYEFILLRGPLLQAMSRLFVIGVVLWFLRQRAEPEADSGSLADRNRSVIAKTRSRVG